MIVTFFPRLPTLVIVYTIYSLLKPRHSAHYPYSLRKRQHYYQLPNIEFSQYKIVSLIDGCSSIDDYTLYVLYHFVMFYVF